MPVWAGVIVTDLETALPWYTEATGARVTEEGDRWAALAFRDGSGIEMHEGDPARPGLTFPSYGSDTGPPVMPGYSVVDAELVARGLDVARSLPGWMVVVAPDGLRIVLADRDSDDDRGLVGFAFATPGPARLQGFLERVGASGSVERGATVRVVPLVAGGAEAEMTDPDGNPVRIVRI